MESKRCLKENFTWIVANTPQGPPSCCTKPIDVSVSGLNLHPNNYFLAITTTITILCYIYIIITIMELVGMHTGKIS